jgi:hypothetical protein
MDPGGSVLSEKLEGLVVATDTPVVEMEELQSIIAEGQERGFLTAESVTSAVEEAELTGGQAQDLFSYLEEHGIEVLGLGDSPHGDAHISGESRDSAPTQDTHEDAPLTSPADAGEEDVERNPGGRSDACPC